jgi:hypothetical protein
MADTKSDQNETFQAGALNHQGGPYLRLATAYVPPQLVIREMYALPEALQKGTLFPELYQPYSHHHKYRSEGEV